MISLPEPKKSTLLDLLSTITLSICKNSKDNFEVAHYPDKFLLTVKVDPSDQGRMVGKRGSVIWSIQTIMWYAGRTLSHQFYTLKLLEPEAPFKGLQRPFKFNEKWDRKIIENLCYKILDTVIPLHYTYEMKEIDNTTAQINLGINKYLQTPMCDPNFGEAFSAVVHAAGMSLGATIQTEVKFE